jgi:alpha-D-ribose 1-methylphosphonate 5-triphosphate synthase subunit PhnG
VSAPSADGRDGALPPRGQWSRLWALADRAEVCAAARELASGLRLEPVAPPESGLVLLALRDGVAGVPFHLGDMPAARVAVRLRTGDGRSAEGGAIVGGEDLELAQAIAVLDAVLAHGLPGSERARASLRRGAARAAEIDRRRALLLARTRVDFQGFAELAGDPG